MIYLKKYWKKIIFVFLSFIFIWVGFDYLMGSSVIQQKSSTLFSLTYVMLISFLIIVLPKKSSVVLYVLTYLFVFVVCIVQYFYFSIIGSFFGIVDTSNASEGFSFVNYIFEHLGDKIILFVTLGLILFVITLISILKTNHYKFSRKYLFITIVLMIICLGVSFVFHQSAIKSLGEYQKDNMWFEENNFRNIYEKFNIRNTCMQICGIYEYTIRDIVLYVKNNLSLDIVSKTKEIDEYFNDNQKISKKNKYTGVLANQNVIIIQLEGIDSWMVNDEIMPTLNYLSKHGLNFTNRYAPNFGGGRTQNTEYAINTGLYIPVNGYNIYESYKNNFDYSLANVFKDNGYKVNSIHYNHGYFYGREKLHKAFGFENYYSLLDLNIGGDEEYWYNDENLVDNEEAYNLIVPDGNEKFLSYVITMSAHGVFNDEYPICKNLTAEECIYKSAKTTDNFLNKLLKKMDNDNLLDNTTFVLISDHYAYSYGFDNIKKLKKLDSDNSDGEVDKVPFVIWNNSIPRAEIDTILDSADILPTLINLFGFNVDPNNYLGTDVFSDYHEKFVYFKDRTYIAQNNTSDLTKIVDKRIEINDDIIVTNYYKNK